MALKQLRGQQITVGDAFDFWYAAPALLLAAAISGVAETVGMSMCILPSFLIGGLLMLAVPAILDKRVNAIEGLKMSLEALKDQAVMAALFYFVASVILGLGFCLCGIGALFTIPIYVMATTLIYRDFLMQPATGTQQASAPYPPPPIPDPDHR